MGPDTGCGNSAIFVHGERLSLTCVQSHLLSIETTAKLNLNKLNGKFLLTKCTRKTKPAIKNSLFIYLLLVASFRQAPPDGGRENRRTIYVHNRNNPIIKGSTFCGRRFEEEHDVAADE